MILFLVMAFKSVVHCYGLDSIPPNSEYVEFEDNSYSSCPCLVFHIVHTEFTAVETFHIEILV